MNRMTKRETDYEERREKETFRLTIPEGPVPRPHGGFLDTRGGAGHHSYQHYTEYCLDEHGNEPPMEAFKATFAAWSLEGADGVVLHPEGPAFKAIGVQFMEGDEPVTYHVDAAHYTALMLCLHPTVYVPSASGDEQLASYEVLVSWEPNGPVDYLWVPQRPVASTGEIFMWKHNYFPQKVAFKIRIVPSPAGRNTVYLAGRLGTILSGPSESI